MMDRNNLGVAPDTIQPGTEGDTIRHEQEALEAQWLHPLAAKSGLSKGRQNEEPLCSIRTAFQRDRDRIIHAKAFRRLKHKTQVFFLPQDDHYRTRLTHTLAVAQVARTISRALRLNEDLTEAIALAHDLGHPPFGHIGERVLNEIYPEGFHHYLQSVRIAERIEPLNLSFEVMDSLRKDSGVEEPAFLEGQVVKLADRMAYLHHDVEDATRAGLMSEIDLPDDIVQVLGADRETRLDKMVLDMVHTTKGYLKEGIARVGLSDEVSEAMSCLRAWMFEHIYLTEVMQYRSKKVHRLISGLYEFYCLHPDLLPYPPGETQDDTLEQRAVDYIAGMTDRFAIDAYTTTLLPKPYRPELKERFGE